MFKAIHSRSEAEVVILSPEWAGRAGELREMGRDDVLICPGCRQPVRVRAGAIVRRHFAHKHLNNCPYGQDSAELLGARALLYERLARQFGEQATLEERLEGAGFPRAVDCWVARAAGPFGYWILDRAVRPPARDALKEAAERAGASIHWVFTAGMLRFPEEPGRLICLTTTERDLQAETYFDTVLRRSPNGAPLLEKEGASLHYLNPADGTLTTFRSLRQVHEPQVFGGRSYAHPLSEALVAPKTGEFAHPGERERMAALRRQHRRLEAAYRERRRREEERRRQEQERREQARRERQRQEERTRLLAAREREIREREERERELRACEDEERQMRLAEEHRAARRRGPGAQPGTPGAEPPEPRRRAPDLLTGLGPSITTREGTCVFCGHKTTDWWTYDAATGECKCHACLRAGRH
ncbi:MAG: hypothetical protein HY321_16105 [Armatimonadetes bacterium]|nr:hypothetical protein [Armatimonadota bacterium]